MCGQVRDKFIENALASVIFGKSGVVEKKVVASGVCKT